MQARKFKFPSEMHGNASGTMQQYFNAIGLTKTDVQVRPTAPTTNPLPTGSVGSAVSPVGVSTGPVSSVGPSVSSNTVASTNLPTSPSSSTITTSTTNPLPNTGAITTPNLSQPLTPTAIPVMTPVIQVVGNPLLVAKNPNGTTVSTPLTGGFGGGFGGGGYAEEENSRMAEVKKKSNLFPWLLIAAGIYIIVKNPIK